MSWSFSAIGRPANIIAALDEESAKLSGPSKVEFDEALPHLKGLLQQNYHADPTRPVLKLEANGHGSAGERQCKVSIEPTWTRLV